MVLLNLNTLVALEGVYEETPAPKPRRVRRNWVRGEVRCIMCARLIGRLLGSDERGKSKDRSSKPELSFFAFRSADLTQRVSAYLPGMRFRCADCGGTGALDDVDYFSTYDDVPMNSEDEEPIRRGPGRPPRPMRPAQPNSQGVAAALAALADAS